VLGISAYSRCIVQAAGSSTHYSTVPSLAFAQPGSHQMSPDLHFYPVSDLRKNTGLNDRSESSSPNPEMGLITSITAPTGWLTASGRRP